MAPRVTRARIRTGSGSGEAGATVPPWGSCAGAATEPGGGARRGAVEGRGASGEDPDRDRQDEEEGAHATAV